MIRVINVLMLLMMCGVTFAQITADFYANSDLRSPRVHRNKHHFYKALLFHYVHGVVIVLIIIKIAMAMGFVGMVSVVTRMFAAIKFLFKDTSKEATPTYIYPHHPHHSSHEIEYEPLGPGDKFHRRRGQTTNGVNPNVYSGPNQGVYRPAYNTRPANNPSGFRQDLSGGRNFGNDAAYSVQIKENKERRKRDLEKNLNSDDAGLKLRNKRRKDGLAKYWDHDKKKTFKDCIEAFPCHPEKTVEKKEELKTTTTTTTTTEKNEIYFVEESREAASVEYESPIWASQEVNIQNLNYEMSD